MMKRINYNIAEHIHMFLRRLMIAAIFLTGCSVIVKPSPTVSAKSNIIEMPQTITWINDSVGLFTAHELWLNEAKKRLHNPIIFVCHGGYEDVVQKAGNITITSKEWWLYPDPPRQKMSVKAAAQTFGNLYPDHDLVFIVCNKQGFSLDVPHVFYVRDDVWFIPDDINIPNMRHETERGQGDIGSIWEFISSDEEHSNLTTEPN